MGLLNQALDDVEARNHSDVKFVARARRRRLLTTLCSLTVCLVIVFAVGSVLFNNSVMYRQNTSSTQKIVALDAKKKTVVGKADVAAVGQKESINSTIRKTSLDISNNKEPEAIITLSPPVEASVLHSKPTLKTNNTVDENQIVVKNSITKSPKTNSPITSSLGVDQTIQPSSESTISSEVGAQTSKPKAPPAEKQPVVQQAINDSRKAAIQKSSEQLEREVLAEIHRLKSAGLLQQAESLAGKTLQQTLHKSEKLAAETLHLLLQQQKYSRAESLLAERSQLGERHRLIQAKLLQIQHGDSAALAYLQASKSSNESDFPLDEPELAMLAGLLQKQRQFVQSESAYRQLLLNHQQNSVYWLGLAVALDSQLKQSGARAAYQRAQWLGGHSAAVADFIAERIVVLANQDLRGEELTQW